MTSTPRHVDLDVSLDCPVCGGKGTVSSYSFSYGEEYGFSCLPCGSDWDIHGVCTGAVWTDAPEEDEGN